MKEIKNGEVLRKRFTLEKSSTFQKTADGVIGSFIISTAAVDRDEEVISPDGWKLDNYRNNPIVQYGHNDQIPPIGKSLKEYLQNGMLISDCQFTPKEINPFGDMIGNMVLTGFLNAVSVGFMPIAWQFIEDMNRPERLIFTEQELLEYSVVNIPCNPEALGKAKSLNIDLTPLYEESIKCLEVGGFLSKDNALQIYKTLNTKSISIPKNLNLYKYQVEINKNK